MKVVINRCSGGFGLSEKAVERYFELKQWNLVKEPKKFWGPMFYKDSVSEETFFSEYSVDRSDPDLIRAVEELGEQANGMHASLQVVEIPDDVQWHIGEYDGVEWIAEDHRTWG